MAAAAVAKWLTVASINQAGTGIRLPSFCNLGVMLRSMVAVNVLLAAAAVIRARSLESVPGELLGFAAFGEPMLIVSVVALCAARRWLVKMGYGAAYAMIAAFELALAAIFHRMAANLGVVPELMPFTQFAAITVIVAGLALAYFDFRMRALSPAVAEARIQALQARIRPHFLYNSINAVLALMRSDPRRAERALEDLADLFRVLMADNRTLAPIGNEIELARQYLAIEELRLGERLRVRWDIDAMPADALVPPLVLQPLVENAVYHGIEPSETGGEIAIEVRVAGEELVIRLTNPFRASGDNHAGNRMALANPVAGSGKTHAAGNRMAIVNIRERLQLHFDAEASMRSEVHGGKYRVTIRMPYITAIA
jgi:two-component system sensor histidine kinase AlgZ